MKVSEYCRNYTTGEYIHLKHTFFEIIEMFGEVIKLNWHGVKEEWQDALVYFQCWLFWRFKTDGTMWKASRESAKKFMNRREIWHDIYVYAGLPRNTSNFCGNYKRPEKVIKQLAKYGVDPAKAREAYDRIVNNI